MFAEVFKVPAIVKDKETALPGVFPVDLIRTDQFRTKACSTPDHLPEFRFGTHFFEEHQVDAFGDVDTRIHHIYGDCDIRRFLCDLEIVNDRLRVGVVADDTLGKASLIAGIQLVEAFQDEFACSGQK